MDNTEIKETITRGQAMDIADSQIYNEDVKAVDVAGREENAWNKNVLYNPKKEVDFNEDIDLVSYSIDGIYGYKEDEFKQRLFATDERHSDGIRVTGYASLRPDNNRRDRKDGQFDIYFDNREQIISFANKCLDMLLIAQETKALKERYKGNWYDGKHPEILNHFPNFMERTQCETGRYYWDASLNKVVEITEDTDKDILDAHPHRDYDNEGNFEPDWRNEDAEELLLGLQAGIDSNWDGELYQGINLAEIQTGIGGGYQQKGISQHRGKDPNDKRRKQWTTKFYMTDGTVETLVGYWAMTNAGTITRREYLEK